MELSVSGPTFEEIQIPVPFGFVSGKWWGPKDKQPIIAIHGWQDNAGTFDPLIELLPKDLSILCIDLPGHGRSSHIPLGLPYYIFWDGLAILRRIVRHYNWKNVSIMGHSLGAAIGFLYAASYPDDTEMLISIDTVAPVIFDPSEIVKNTGPNVDKLIYYDGLGLDKMPSYKYSDMIDLVVDGHHGTLTRKSCEILMRRGMYRVNDNKYLFSRDIRLKVAWMGLPSLDVVIAFAGQITCRYMNIKAKPYRSLDNWPVYSQVLEIIKMKAKYFVFKEYDGTHHLHLNNPECLASDVATFIQRSISSSVNRFALPSFDITNEFAKQIRCRYLMIKAVPGRVRDNWSLFQSILETIKQSTADFNYVEVEGSHHVHLNEASKVAPHILNFFLNVA